MEDITYEDALKRLEEIANIVQNKELDLEKSLDFLEEGIKLVNFCNDSIDKTGFQLDN